MGVNSRLGVWLCIASLLALPGWAAAQERGLNAPSLTTTFQPSTIGPGSVSTLELSITNGSGSPVTDLAFTDTLPAAVAIADPASASTTCNLPPGASLSAPDGGSTITLSGGEVGAFSTCTVTVDVTSSTAGAHTHPAVTLSSSQGSSQSQPADLTVTTARPGFSKSFGTASVALGARNSLTITIDNSANTSALSSLSFVDNLPPGLQIASPANASTNCGGSSPTLTAAPGTSTVSFSSSGILFPGFEVLLAGATCTVTADVVATTRGTLINRTSELTSNVGSSGRASAALDVVAGTVHLTKAFLEDPVPPGGTLSLEFTLRNFSRDTAATAINFTDDLDNALSGLVASAPLPSEPCGPGSSLSGTGLLSLTGGTLAPEGSCTFQVDVSVPLSATPGIYTNTTSAVGFDLGGDPETGEVASDDLFVFPAPILTKTFLDDPVTPGDTTRIEFTITNTSSISAATDIAFTDVLSVELPTASATPGDGACGAGSTLTFTPLSNPPSPASVIPATLTLSGGSLSSAGTAGDSCTFTLTMDVTPDAPTGTVTNTTTAITATVDGGPVTGNPATDDLDIVAAPALSKSFTDDPVAPGDTVTLEFTLELSQNSPADALDIAFSDDLNATLAGLSAIDLPLNDVCGAGSQLSGTTTLSFTGGVLAAGEECTFTVTLQVPAAAPSGDHSNTTSAVSATVGGLTVSSNPAQDDLTVAALLFTKEFVGDPVIPGEAVTLRFSLENLSPSQTVSSLFFTDSLSTTLSGLAATALPASPCGAGSQITGTTFLIFTGGNLDPQSQCTFDVTLQGPPGAQVGDYINTTSNLTAMIDGQPAVLPPATDTLTLSTDLLSLTKSFTDDPVAPGDTVTLEFTVTNLDATRATTAIAFTDDLDAALSGLSAVGLPAANICGAGSAISGTSVLSLTGGTLPAGGSCTFQVTLQTPASAATSEAVNVTSEVTGTVDGLPVTGAAATDTLLLRNLDFTKAFDGPTVAGSTAVLSFTITNLSSAEGTSNLAFTDDLDAVLTGMVAVGLPVADSCGTGSQLAGTSFLTFNGGSLAPSGSCTFDVTVQLPGSASPGDYSNTTSDLSSAGLSVADPATATLTVEPPPAFTKAFAPDTIPSGGTSTLTFLVNNTASTLAASGLDFTDNLPAGLIAATPTNAATTCVGGTVTAAAGTGTISYTGGTVPAGGSCTVSVDVTSSVPGTYVNVSGDLTSSSGNSGTATATLTVQDDVAPEVTGVSTPAGTLASCDSVRDPIDSIEVTIEDDLSAIQNADDLSSYRLVEAGPDGDFSTISCGGGASGDDIAISMDSLSLTTLDPRSVAVELGFAGPGLDAGLYRLLVCDTITDAAGNALDGDSSMSPGGDFELDFRADPLNLFENGHFDDCPASLDPWIDVVTPPNTIMTGAAGTDDSGGSPLSTSARIDHAAFELSALAQCVAVKTGVDYLFEASLRFATATGSLATVTTSCEFYNGAACSGASLGSSSQTTLVEDNAAQWFDLQGKVVAPEGSLSALCDLAAGGFGDDPTFTLFVDDLVLAAPALIFTDGFESGDTSAWSTEVP